MRKIFKKFGIGSQSADISSLDSVKNPLQPCPNSLNCIRITRSIELAAEPAFKATLAVVKSLRPVDLNTTKENYRIDSIFRVFFFYDDMEIQLTPKDTASSYIHIRSASRIGFSDLGVNTRRVKKFLKRLDREL